MKWANGIECVIKSVNEPQLDRCCESVYAQTVKFKNVVHINGISPESKAVNTAIKHLSCEWSLWVDGDMILYSDAHEKILGINKIFNVRVNEARFGLFDPFLGKDICCCILRKNSFLTKFKSKNVLDNDAKLVLDMKRHGRSSLNLWKKVIVGTHFDSPTDFQVFSRFYSRGVKYAIGHPSGPYSDILNVLNNKYASTNNKQYIIAKEAFEFGRKTGNYPTSHDILFDKKLYAEWKMTRSL